MRQAVRVGTITCFILKPYYSGIYAPPPTFTLQTEGITSTANGDPNYCRRSIQRSFSRQVYQELRQSVPKTSTTVRECFSAYRESVIMQLMTTSDDVGYYRSLLSLRVVRAKVERLFIRSARINAGPKCKKPVPRPHVFIHVDSELYCT